MDCRLGPWISLGRWARAADCFGALCAGSASPLFPAPQTATLVVGNQKLTGTLTDLPKPLAVLRKGEHAAEGGARQVSYEVTGFIHKKIIFKGRPQPLISTAALQTSTSKRKR